MKVNDRKLFANRDARRQLSQMGGIVASSPELLGAAQQFAPGGMVTPYERSVGRLYEMTSDELQDAGLPRFAGSAMGYLGRNRAMDMLQNIDPNIGREEFERMSPQERRDAGFPSTGLINRQYFDIRDELMESQFPMQGPEMPAAGPTRLTAEEYTNPVDEFGGAGMPSTPTLPTPAEPTSVTRTPEEEGGDPSTMETFPAEEEVVRRTPEEPVILSPAEAAAAEADGTGSTAEDRVLTAEELAEIVNTSDDPSGAMADTILGTRGEGAPSSVEERISQYEALFGRMFGQDDEEKNRERWMNMAMIGFAIAAGEDPSALKNIADGLLQGAQVSREDMATRRQRQDRIQELAVAAGLEDERLAQRLAGESRFSPTEPFVDAVRTLAQSSLDQGLYPDIGSALRASEEALAPYYNLASRTGGVEISTVTTQEEYDALEPGTEFIQIVDGEMVSRRKPAE